VTLVGWEAQSSLGFPTLQIIMDDYTREIIEKMADKIRARVIELAEERYSDIKTVYESKERDYDFEPYFIGAVYSLLADEIFMQFENEESDE